jgi:hypothetical protein
MAQCVNHESFVQIALDFGWTLWEYGQDTACEHYPELVSIWIQPCTWDWNEDQQVPVGCLCCTDLDQALTQWHEELHSVLESRRGHKMVNHLEESKAVVLDQPANFLQPYLPR